jgi:hypothetical protein
LFAGLMMIMVGIWQALEGLIAIFENEFYVATCNYLFHGTSLRTSRMTRPRRSS